jgi:hypothetical protein
MICASVCLLLLTPHFLPEPEIILAYVRFQGGRSGPCASFVPRWAQPQESIFSLVP